jgi:hypothetical protein
MNKFIYLLFTSVFFLDYMAVKLAIIHPSIAWLPDILSMVAVLVVVVLAGSRDGAISTKYVVLFLCLIAVILIGLASNSTTAGSLIIGIRNYLKFLPFFFLPAVFLFSEEQVSSQLKLLLAFVLLQGPLALYQKFIQFGVTSSGDLISGTLQTGGQLPILLTAAMAILTGFYLRQRISTVRYIIFLSLMVVPVMLTESKASIGYIPLAFIVPIFTNYRTGTNRKNGKQILGVLTLLAVVGFAFVATYDYFAQFGRESRRAGLIEFFVSGTAENYLNRGAIDSRRVNKTGYVDIVLLPLSQLSDEPFKLFFGLGIGSVSGSAIESLAADKPDTGDYTVRIASSVSQFLWEIGVLGLIIYFLFFYMLYNDARRLSKGEGVLARLALGWTGVIAIGTLALFFRVFFEDGAIAYPFWFYAGMIAANAVRMKKVERKKMAANIRAHIISKDTETAKVGT